LNVFCNKFLVMQFGSEGGGKKREQGGGKFTPKSEEDKKTGCP